MAKGKLHICHIQVHFTLICD